MTTTTRPTPGCDTQDMVAVHRMFRRLFRDGAALVRSVDAGDDEHRRVVVDHLLQICGALHGHHKVEDDHLWDRLSEKAPACAIHVQLMQRQHASMAAELDAVETHLVRWRASGSAEDARASEAGAAAVLDSLEQHLGDEERRILPEASRVLSQKEWNVLHTAAKAEKMRLPDFVRPVSPWVQLGLMLDGLDAEQLRQVRHVVPAPAIVLFRLFGRRKYEAYRRRLWAIPAG